VFQYFALPAWAYVQGEIRTFRRAATADNDVPGDGLTRPDSIGWSERQSQHGRWRTRPKTDILPHTRICKGVSPSEQPEVEY